MNKKSLQAIEKIIIYIYELKFLIKDKSAEYFYNSFEMPILCDIVSEIENNINKINTKIKNKYDNIDWQIISKQKHHDDILGESITIGKVWELASTTLNDKLLEDLLKILESEIPNYYKHVCNQRHTKTKE